MLYKNLYIIFTRRGIEIDKYPTIKNYLSEYKEELTPKSKNSSRNDKGRKPGDYKWYEIQDNVAYFSSFEKEKIIYSEISNEPSFTLDLEKHYLGNTAYIMNSDNIDLKYLLGLLNSNVLFWIFQKICYNLGNKGFRFIKNFVEQLPIIIDNKNQENVITLVDNILRLNNEIEICENYLFDILKNKYKINDFPKKIENFYLLSSKEFIKEIKKKNNNIDENYLLKIHEKTKANILNLMIKIKSENTKLNNLVYDIYNLNEREISIIEKEII